MKVRRIKIDHFRGIRSTTILLPGHAVLIGDNNVGKTTILEALDLVLGPDRLNRFPPIDEHDFYQGQYLPENLARSEDEVEEQGEGEAIADAAKNNLGKHKGLKIEIEVTIVDLSEEQKSRFNQYIEFWHFIEDRFEDQLEEIDRDHITEALRVTFHGWYDDEEDDFKGKTYFTKSLWESDRFVEFSKKDKQYCGYLYLRSLRTGSRALSLERGSLLDIILRLKEIRPQMWEHTIDKLADFTVAEDPKLGFSDILKSIDTELRKYVPKEWGTNPRLKVSNLTREHLRKVTTAFIETGEGDHVAPFYSQGTGTINMIVLAMLSQIAESKQNVIFAMEEPETAIPPYAQKRIVHEIRSLASQAIFTSHSPYVIEEFTLKETIVLGHDSGAKLQQRKIELPDNLRLKTYRQEFRTRFCEGLLSRRVLIAEGVTEATAFPAVCRRLAEINPDKYKPLEALGICILDAGGDSKIAGVAKMFRKLGKRIYALCDKQEEGSKASIEAQVDFLLMHDEKSIEKLVINNTTDEALIRFANSLDWPQHIEHSDLDSIQKTKDDLTKYFKWSKGDESISDFLVQCSENEIPQWIRNACKDLMCRCDLDSKEY